MVYFSHKGERHEYELWCELLSTVGLTLGEVGLVGLEAPVALRQEVLGHAVGPGGRERKVGRAAVFPRARALAQVTKRTLIACICKESERAHYITGTH